MRRRWWAVGVCACLLGALGLTSLLAPARAAFPGANGKIAFASTRGAVDVYVMNADGTNQTRLTTDAAFDGEPAFSPDGPKIAFQSERAGNVEVHA